MKRQDYPQAQIVGQYIAAFQARINARRDSHPPDGINQHVVLPEPIGVTQRLSKMVLIAHTRTMVRVCAIDRDTIYDDDIMGLDCHADFEDDFYDIRFIVPLLI